MHTKSLTAAIIASAFGSAALLPSVASSAPAAVPTYQFEKCYGVSAAGKNDCASTGNHDCAGLSKRASDPKSWVYLPSGTCSKIQGGSTAAKS